MHKTAKTNRKSRGAQQPARIAGFTLVELIVAVGILMTVLMMTLTLVQEGIGKLADMRIKGKVKECARLTMEYFSTIPPDVVYGMSKGSPQTSNFKDGMPADEDLRNFVNDSYPVCRELSDPSTALGAKVQLQYTLCPGCITYGDIDNPNYSMCIYFYKIRLQYNGLQYGGTGKTIDFMGKVYTGQSGDCDDGINANGCGPGPPGSDLLKNCTI